MKPSPPNGDREFISVVIPTRNRCGTLEECLEALSLQTYPRDRFEVVVVDDGSTDGTRRLLEAMAARFPFLRHIAIEHGGPARARNAGVREARGPLILFTGDDCVASPSLLEEHARAHRLERNVAVLGAIAWHPDLDVTPFMEYVGRTHQFSFPIIEQERLSVSFGFFYTSNISVAKDLLLKAGLFDEEFTDAVYEDAELGYRLWRGGVRIIYRRRALTRHRHAVTLNDYIKRQVRLGKAGALFFRKHPELAQTLKVEEAASPEVRESFYDSVLRYYYAVGIQEGIESAGVRAAGPSAFLVPFDDILKKWSATVSDRLLRALKHERGKCAALWERLGREERLRRELEESIPRLKERNALQEGELRHYRDFADRVKATIPYRVYKSIRALLGRD